ncbi:SHOCT domain-containing protein [Metaplanococcus flavidus]|uniref:SHOCT domain-containing protein n=1 Tax=Metaplanococcus flavidus TaxID=569883 RepID=A0ABW3L8L8_9BACL
MEILLLSTIPMPLGLLGGLLIFLAGVLIIFWFFMARNDPKSRSVDSLPPVEDKHSLQGQYNRGEISEEEYHQKVKDLEDQTKRPF